MHTAHTHTHAALALFTPYCPSHHLPSCTLLLAGAHTYLQRFVAEYTGGPPGSAASQPGSLALLPNYSYSLPLAVLRQEQQQQQQQKSGSCSTDGAGNPSVDEAGGQSVPSVTLLAQALLLHPLVLNRLMERLQSQGVGRDAAWGSLLRRRLFAQVRLHARARLLGNTCRNKEPVDVMLLPSSSPSDLIPSLLSLPYATHSATHTCPPGGGRRQ